MNIEIIAILGLGFLLGIEHAFEPDHMIAVSSIITVLLFKYL